MPQFVNTTDEVSFKYDSINSTPLTGASSGSLFVSTILPMQFTDNGSILLGTTAGFELYASNANSMSYETSQYMAYHDTQYGGNVANFISNPSFSGTWVNVTNHPTVKLGDKAFYLCCPYRWLQLRGTSVTSSATAMDGSVSTNVSIGRLWTHDMFNGSA